MTMSMIERFWRSIKYEDIYFNSYDNGIDLEGGIALYIERYNTYRLHASLNDATPEKVYNQEMQKAA